MTEALRAILLPLWPVLAASCAIGLVFGMLGWREQPAGFWGRLGIILVVIGLVGAAGLAVSGRVSGRPGLWLDIGISCLATYVVGCLAGGLARALWRSLVRRSEAPMAGV